MSDDPAETTPEDGSSSASSAGTIDEADRELRTDGGTDDDAGPDGSGAGTSTSEADTEGGEAGTADSEAGADDGASGGDGDDTGEAASGTAADSSDASTDGGTLDGRVTTPPDDEELPLTAHIEEMLGRLFIVAILATAATLVVFPFASDLVAQIWYDVHPGDTSACVADPSDPDCVPPHLFGPFELVLMRLRVAGLAGLLVALPAAVYQTYRFMRPGLYPHERRYYLASVPFSLVLGVVGMMFSYFVILPLLFEYFITYTEGSAEAAFALTDTMNLVLIMLGMMAVIFQIPLLIMLAIMMGITTREWLEQRRIYFWGLFLGVAFLFGPDPTGMAPILLTITMIVLFEASLLLLRWTGR